MFEVVDTWVFTWIIVPLLIFVARILDISIGTLRLIFMVSILKHSIPSKKWPQLKKAISENLSEGASFL